MGLIDTHAHLDGFQRQGALAGVLTRARGAGLEAVIAIGTEPADWAVNLAIARETPGFVHWTAGLHPCSIGESWDTALSGLEALWRESPRPVALGECGLDRFHLPKEPAEAERAFAWQRAAFAAQLALARRLDCPLVIHSRGAFRECVDMISASGVDWGKVVFHCFVEGPAEVAELNRLGARASFTGILTYKNADTVRAAAKTQGLDRLMVETDCPYLAPVPRRGEPCEPAFVRHTAEFAASLLGVSLPELEAATTANAKRFFAI